MRKFIFILLAFFLVAAGIKRPVIVTIPPPAPVEVTAGQKLDYALQLSILKGYHIQANPVSQEFLIPVTVKLEEIQGITFGEINYPKGVSFRLKGSNKDMSVYDGIIQVKIPLQVDPNVKTGEMVLKGTLRYQGCDDILCFPPTTLPFQGKLLVK